LFIVVNMIVELQDSRTAPCTIEFLPREELALHLGDACVASVDLAAQEQQGFFVLQRGDIELVAQAHSCGIHLFGLPAQTRVAITPVCGLQSRVGGISRRFSGSG
jgi:hypothetical protein